MGSKPSILLIAHGSREKQANDEVRALALRLESSLTGQRVFPCFLEIEPPSIIEAFRQSVETGSNSILAFPFFLSTGAHVSRDIPALLGECLLNYPQVTVQISPALGPDQTLDRVILDRLARGGTKLELGAELESQ